jgi:hypothetical protein
LPAFLDEAYKKLMEGFWICWVGVQNVLKNYEFNVGFWNIRLIQFTAGFCPKAKMVPPENIN